MIPNGINNVTRSLRSKYSNAWEAAAAMIIVEEPRNINRATCVGVGSRVVPLSTEFRLRTK